MPEVKSLHNLNDTIRRHYDQSAGKWYFSIVDIIDTTGESTDARNYWKVLKNRLKKTHNQLVTSCIQHKMESGDGKFYLTDTGDSATIIQILNIVSKESISSFEEYLATLSQPKSSNVLSLGGRKSGEIEEENIQQKVRTSSYPQEEILGEEFELKVDLYIQNKVLILEAFVAGVSLADLSITATCGMLTIKGKREVYNSTATEDYAERELPWGNFSRQIWLPYEIEINKLEAVDDRGLVTIRMPLIDKSYARRIKIKSL